MRSVPVVRSLLVVSLVLLLAGFVAGCGGSQSEIGPWLYHPDTIQVFLKNSGTPEQVTALQNEIRAMPEVSSVTYISSDQAKQKLSEELQSQGLDPAQVLAGKQVPASFEVKVGDESRITDVANRLGDRDIIDNTPGKHDGVRVGLSTGAPKPVVINLNNDGTFSISDGGAEIMKGSYSRTGNDIALFSSANSVVYRGSISGDQINDLLWGYWTRQ